VSKDHLDVAFPGASHVWRIGNDKSGFQSLGRKLRHLDFPHLFCEATGSFTRLLASDLARRNIAF